MSPCKAKWPRHLRTTPLGQSLCFARLLQTCILLQHWQQWPKAGIFIPILKRRKQKHRCDMFCPHPRDSQHSDIWRPHPAVQQGNTITTWEQLPCATCLLPPLPFINTQQFLMPHALQRTVLSNLSQAPKRSCLTCVCQPSLCSPQQKGLFNANGQFKKYLIGTGVQKIRFSWPAVYILQRETKHGDK